jgi:hypothetical protein
MAPVLVLIIMLVLGIALAGAVAVAALELREVAIMREDLRKALTRAKLAERALSDLRIKRSRDVSQGNRTRAAVQAARRDVATDQIQRDAALKQSPPQGPCPRSGKTTGSSMNGPRSPECAEAVRRWMLAQISERANVFYQGPMPAAGGGDAGHHFSISVPWPMRTASWPAQPLRAGAVALPTSLSCWWCPAPELRPVAAGAPRGHRSRQGNA